MANLKPGLPACKPPEDDEKDFRRICVERRLKISDALIMAVKLFNRKNAKWLP